MAAETRKIASDPLNGDLPPRPSTPPIGETGTAPVRVAGRYVVESEIARGGMGVVYRVVDSSTGMALALKRSLETKADAAALEREYRTLVSLRHPRIVQVYDFGVDEHSAFYTMELLDGADLRARSPLHWRDVCKNLREVASSLALLHSRRLLHRDVSAANIRLTGEGRAKLIDFGALASFGKCSSIAGTPSGVAPEALEGRDLDHRVDLYSLGATAYFALTGRHAYPARTLADLNVVWARGAPVPPSKLVGEIPAELDELVLSLLSMDRSTRPASAAEVIDRLAAIAGFAPEEDDQVAQSYLIGQELVGRNKQFARLRVRLDKAITGHGSAMVIEGRSGLGRTALLQRLEREARIAGATVLTVSARAHQRPFGLCFALTQRASMEIPQRAVPLVKEHLTHLERLLRYSRPVRPSGPTRDKDSLSADPSDDTSNAFEQFLLALAATGPVVVLVDDVHAGDGDSLPVLASLAKLAPQHRLLIVATIDSDDGGHSRAAIDLLRRSSSRVRIRPLTLEHIEQLVRTMFGDVSATKRLATWLHHQSAGSPLLCTELIAHLVKLGSVHYAEGTWVLPHEFPQEDVNAVLAKAMQAQLERLRPEWRRFAECLSPHPRSLDTELCESLRSADPELARFDAVQLLTDLVSEGVLVGDAGEYAFARPRVRELLYQGMDDKRRRQLHERAGANLAERAEGDAERSFEAGWHLLLAGDRRGAAARIGRSMAEIGARPDELVRAAPQLKDLYQQYMRVEHSQDELLPVTACLVIAGFYVDPTVHDQFGDSTAVLLQQRTGFALAARLVPWLGYYVALTIGVVWGALQFAWASRMTKGMPFDAMLRSFVGVCASRSAVAYLRLEQGVHELMLKLLSPAKGLHPHNALRLVHDLMALTIAESNGELEKRADGYRDQLSRLPHVKILDEARHHYEAGLLCSLGHLHLYCTDAGAVECADRVDALGGQHDRVVAQFLRVSYHLFRGETAKAQAADEALDGMAAKYGHRWVPDVLGVLDLVPYHLSADVVGLKRVLHRTERLLALAPRFTVYRDMVRAMYEGHRGRHEVALKIYEGLAADVAPFTHPAWSFAHAHKAECLNALGQHEQALAVCQDALKQIGAASRVYVVAYQQLEREAAMALAHLGKADEAARLLDELIAFHAQDSHPLLIGLLHRDRARVALLANDRDSFERHTERACAEFFGTGNPTLLRQGNRLKQLSQTSQDAVLDQESPLVTALIGAPVEVVAEHALQHMVTLCGASRAQLYLLREGRAVLSAQLGAGEADPRLLIQVEQLMESYVEETDTEHTATDEPMSTDAPAFRLFPLLVIDHGRCEPVGVAAVFDCESPSRLTFEQLERAASILRSAIRQRA